MAVAGYLITALGTAAFGLATAAWHVLVARSAAWLGRGIRTPIRKALLAGAVTKETYGRAFGLERMMDTLGAILGPATAFVLLPLLNHNFRRLFALTLIPGLAAAAVMLFLVKEQARKPVAHVSSRGKFAVAARAVQKIARRGGIVWRGRFCAQPADFAGSAKIEALAGSCRCGGRGHGIVCAA